MLPGRGPGGNVTSRGVPLHVGDAIVVSSVHELQVGSQVLVRLWFLALKVEIVEVEIRALRVVDGGHNDESALWRPVDGVAVLLLERPEVLEVTNSVPFGLFGAEEGNRRLGGNSGGANGLSRRDGDESVTLGLPRKVDDCVLDGVDNLDGDTLLLDAENLQSGGLGLLGLGMPVNLNAEVGTL